MISPRPSAGRGPGLIRFCGLAVLALTFIALSSSITRSSSNSPPPIRFTPQQSPSAPTVPAVSLPDPPRGIDAASLCDLPMLLPGTIDDKTNTWVPTYQCRGSTVPFSSLATHAENLRNKTIAVYGDSVMRFMLEHMCAAYQGNMTVENELTPPGMYVRDPHHQATHACHVPQLNFTMYNTYIMGIRNWANNTIDRDFTAHHSTFNFQEDPTVWRFENRMQLVHEVMTKKYGTADAVILGTGVWDLVQLHHEMLEADVLRGVKQTAEPPEDWLVTYRGRLRKYIRLAQALHSGPDAGEKLKNVFMMSLHDLRLDRDDWRGWQMDGMPKEWQEKTEFKALTEERVRRLRITQMEVVREEEERMWKEGKGRARVVMLPYDMWNRAVHPQKRMSDIVHPTGEMNAWVALGLAMAAKFL